MFEDSLVESTGRIRTRSKQFAIGSFALQALLLTALALYPFLHPATLPKQALTMLLTAPAPPTAPANLPQHAAATSHEQPVRIEDLFAAPVRIPQHAAMGISDTTAPPSNLDQSFGQPAGVPGGVLTSLAPSSSTIVKPGAQKGPVHVSSGVAAGQLLTPIQPTYPAIAKAARIQGTVVVSATISKLGTIENLRVVSGPPMLQSAATEAIQKARYRPFMLNGEPVEVETTINVVFTLGG
jgi:protein TonB